MRPQAGFSSDLLIWCLRPPIPKQDQMLRNIEPRPLWGRKKGRGEARQLLTANSLCGIGESQLMCCSTRWCLIRCSAILFKVPLYAKIYQRVLKIAWFSGLSMNSPDGESFSRLLHLSEAVLRCAVLCSLWCHNGHWCFTDTSSRVCEKTLGVVCLPTRWFVGKAHVFPSRHQNLFWISYIWLIEQYHYTPMVVFWQNTYIFKASE